MGGDRNDEEPQETEAWISAQLLIDSRRNISPKRLVDPGPSRAQLESLLALCSRAGVPPINIHGLRHTAAALAYTASRDVHATQHRLGHSSAVTTMRIYSYLLHDDASTAAALDALLDPQRQKNGVVIKTPRASLALRASTKPGKDARSA